METAIAVWIKESTRYECSYFSSPDNDEYIYSEDGHEWRMSDSGCLVDGIESFYRTPIKLIGGPRNGTIVG